jgi:glutamate dehydrogenase/leucine dehydrogenase
LTRKYTELIAPFIGPERDVPAPDVNTNAQTMEWIADEYSKIVGKDSPGVVTGKPLDKGGSKGRDSATAQGGVYILDEYVSQAGMDPSKTRVIVQGYGNAGATAAKLLAKGGYHIIGASDSQGGIVCSHGINPSELMACKVEKSTVKKCGPEVSKSHKTEGVTCKQVSNEELLEAECDILVLASLEDQITEANADRIKAKVILELANGPTRPDGDEILKKKGIVVIPDILANAGGVTVSYFEMLQNASGKYWSEEEVNEKLKKIMVAAWKEVKENSDKYKCTLREAAFITGLGRLEAKMKERG